MAAIKIKMSPGKSITTPLRDLLNKQEAAVLITLIVFTSFFYVRNDAMLSSVTIISILRTMAYPGLIGMGMVLLMITGEIDLSTSAVMSLCAVFAAYLMAVVGWPIWLSVVCALAVAVLVGVVNALVSVKIGVNSLIATIGVGFAARSASYMFTQGAPVYPLPPEITAFGELRPLNLSVAFVLLLLLIVVVQIALNWTRFGAMVFATGGNKTAAEVCGINTSLIKTICFIFTSLLSGCAGLLTMCGLPMPAGDPIIGRNLELNIIVGVVLGGVSFFGGRGSAIGTFLGIMLMQVIYSGLPIARFNPYWQIPALGMLLIVAASVDVIRHRKDEK
jgi:ribose transport system permease protein